MILLEKILAYIDSVNRKVFYYSTENHDYYITTSRSGGFYIWMTKPFKKNHIISVIWLPTMREVLLFCRRLRGVS